MFSLFEKANKMSEDLRQRMENLPNDPNYVSKAERVKADGTVFIDREVSIPEEKIVAPVKPEPVKPTPIEKQQPKKVEVVLPSSDQKVELSKPDTEKVDDTKNEVVENVFICNESSPSKSSADLS